MNIGYNKIKSDEISQHMPRSLQLMLKIETLAQAKVAEILQSIETGETTLEEVLARRQRSNIQETEQFHETGRSP